MNTKGQAKKKMNLDEKLCFHKFFINSVSGENNNWRECNVITKTIHFYWESRKTSKLRIHILFTSETKTYVVSSMDTILFTLFYYLTHDDDYGEYNLSITWNIIFMIDQKRWHLVRMHKLLNKYHIKWFVKCCSKIDFDYENIIQLSEIKMWYYVTLCLRLNHCYWNVLWKYHMASVSTCSLILFAYSSKSLWSKRKKKKPNSKWNHVCFVLFNLLRIRYKVWESFWRVGTLKSMIRW